MENLLKAFNEIKQKKLSIDLTRGKPHSDQLDLSNDLITTPVNPIGENNVDLRNYGEPIGIIEARRLGADILNSKVDLTIAGEQSSYLLMTQLLLGRYLFGLDDDPWKNDKEPAFLCAVPGFDRHFATLEGIGLKMHTVNLCSSGIDLDDLKKKLSKYPNIKGLICVPRHSNPSGEVFSDENITDLLKITKEYNPSFINLFDHAYLIHDFDETRAQTPIPLLADGLGVLDNVAVFTSFSKVTFGGGGMAFLTTGEKNFKLIERVRNMMVICPDKINQRRHVNFFKNKSNVLEHMKKHASLVKPKFELVNKKLSNLSSEVGEYTNPTGGYFVTFYSKKPIAKRIVALCAEVGLMLTPAGSTYPYGNDPNDSVLRIAPTYIDIDELDIAMDIFVLSAQIAHSEI
jgi:DNA-binding transcriptional MocR family regulator